MHSHKLLHKVNITHPSANKPQGWKYCIIDRFINQSEMLDVESIATFCKFFRFYKTFQAQEKH